MLCCLLRKFLLWSTGTLRQSQINNYKIHQEIFEYQNISSFSNSVFNSSNVVHSAAMLIKIASSAIFWCWQSVLQSQASFFQLYATANGSRRAAQFEIKPGVATKARFRAFRREVSDLEGFSDAYASCFVETSKFMLPCKCTLRSLFQLLMSATCDRPDIQHQVTTLCPTSADQYVFATAVLLDFMTHEA